MISPLGGALDWDGYAHTLDSAGVTTAQSTSTIGWSFTAGNKSGTPGTTGGISNWAASTWTDSNTAGSGTATNWVGHAFQRPTLAASNASVTTTNAATVYISNAPLAGTNETITNPYALWVDDGIVRFDGATVNNGSLAFTWPSATGTLPTIATQAEVNAMASTSTAVTPNHNKIVIPGAAVATTSGTAFTFSSIPAGVRKIVITFNEVSLSGTDDLLVQLGDSGGLETTSYVSTSVNSNGTGVGVAVSSTSGFVIASQGAANTVSGSLTVYLADAATFLWVASHSVKIASAYTASGGGAKALSAELTQISITRTGTNTFDAGSINASYER